MSKKFLSFINPVLTIHFSNYMFNNLPCSIFKIFFSTCGRNKSFPNQVLITHTMVHISLSQVLIRLGWEASLPDVGLNKFVRVASAPRPIPKANNTWLGKDSFLPQKYVFWVLRGNPHLPLLDCYWGLTWRSAQCMRVDVQISFLLTWSHTLWYTLP